LPARRSIPALLTRAAWCAVGLLTALGIVAAVGRGVFVADLATRAEPLRQETMRALHRDDPYALERTEEARQFDRQFAAHPVAAWLHVVPGGIFLTLALVQFSSRVRSRHIGFHRWSGRVLIFLALIIVSSALYFGVLMPYAGRGESTAIVLFAGLFFADIIRGFVAIRRGEVARHREWMIRAYAIAIGISTVRVVMLVFDIALAPAGFRLPEVFVLSIWVGWAISVGAAEIWIRYTRRRIHPVAITAAVVRV
jgi:uncharacterized membrane protein